MKKLIFLSFGELNNRNFIKYELSQIKNYFKIEWICFDPNIDLIKYQNGIKIIKIKNYTNFIPNEFNTYILLFPFNFKTYIIHKKLSLNNCNYYYLNIGQQPGGLKYFFINKFIFSILSKNLKKSKKIFISGILTDFSLLYYLANKKTSIHEISSYDYILNLQKNVINNYNKKDYFVFLDEYYEGHPDCKNLIDSEIYLSKINNILSKLENQFNISCIFCPHPKRPKNTYKNFEFAFNENSTAEAVKNCKFVVAHASTSINFAIINEKPIVQLYFDKSIKIKYYKKIILKIHQNLNTILLKENNNFGNKITLSFNKEKYLSYKNKYIKSNKSIFNTYSEILIHEFRFKN